MTAGQLMRRVLGRATDPVARWYRRWYVDLEDFGRTLSRFGPVRRAVEIGCGDGHLTERIVAEFPEAEVLGVDIADDPGRLYRGPREHVTFERMTSADLVRREPGSFDLVVMCDVLHHVPRSLRVDVVSEAGSLLAPGGHLVVKDWVSGRNLASAAAWLSDRYITGDRIEFFRDRHELTETIRSACDGHPIVAEGRVPPRWNNLYLAVRAPVTDA